MSISVSLTEFQDSINKKGIYTMFKKLFTVALLAAASVLSAGDVLFDGLKEGAWGENIEVKDGVSTMNLNYSIKLSKDFIKVTQGRKYTVSGEFFVTGKTPAKTFLYFGFIPYTAKGEEISHAAIAWAMPEAVGELAADVKAGDTSVLLNGAENWKFLPHGVLAFNAKLNRSDLPNFELSDFFLVNKTEKNGDGTVRVYFKKGIAKDYPAGTLVRQHRSGNMFPYVGFSDKSGEWIKFSATFRSFYIGTTQIKLALRLLNRNWPVQMRNVTVVEE